MSSPTLSLVVTLLTVMALGHPLAGPVETPSFELTVLHINDHHSHLDSNRGLRLRFGGDGAAATDVETGGFARVVTKVRELRSRHPNVLTLHAGDAMTGSVYFSLFRGEADAAAMNQVCFDALALGNHEFDNGDAGLARFIGYLNRDPERCRTPVLAANVVPALGTPLYPEATAALIQPYVIKEVGGQRIAILGLDIASKTRNSSSPLASTQFLDERESAQRHIDALTAVGIDKIILLTHYQYLNDLDLARKLRGVDAILGGDSHTLLGESFAHWGLNPSGPYPTLASDLDGHPVCVAQAWQYTDLVGELRLGFDSQGRVIQCAGTPHLLLGDSFERDGRPLEGADRQAVLGRIDSAPELGIVEPDAATTAVIDLYSRDVERLKTTLVGVASENLCLERVPGQGLSAICDARATQANGGDIQQLVSAAYLARGFESDVAIQNAGGVRIDLPAGAISIDDVHRLLPFSNTLVNLRMTGAEIRQALETAVSSFMDRTDGSTGAYPYAANLRWELDLSQPKGRRFSNIEIRRKGGIQWTSLEDADQVTVVTNSFLARGGDGFSTFKAVSDSGRAVDTFIDYAQGFIDYLQQDLGGARPGDPILANPPEVRPLACSEYSTRRFVNAGGKVQRPDPEVPRACESTGGSPTGR
ncbi:bifunctional metallophosphatase/5'-nucleotidase [Thiocystis violacea]|uniref:bifunctional metallophosphatase/5'-nucleotidase n=1 Tax=Thiocystis violacea TaxID=13725 RepID=UPI0019035FE6|nr:5'-nucleotidase C-terminal domain-containing protein [Thiocystis violacea]MBK1716405.1 bifunctional metallophosphatase/5'-nucleotidase [Thiocystis violacea]